MTSEIPLLNVPKLSDEGGASACPILSDRFGRPVTNARISLNSSSRCNFRCIYCHMEGIKSFPSTLMTADEIQRIVSIMSRFGVNDVKLTGGEPMLRPDILEIVTKIKSVGSGEISMTTNGMGFSKFAEPLHRAGLSRVNISLPSLHAERFQFITKVDGYSQTFNAIAAAIDAELLPVKVNMTVLKGVNDDEVEEMMRLVRRLGGDGNVILQLIELVVTNPEFYSKYHYDLKPIEDHLKARAVAVYRRGMHNRLRFVLPDGVTVEVVRPMHNAQFCMGNTRIRITYDGKFKPCLLRDDNHLDFLTRMRAGASDDEIAEIFKHAVMLREPFFKHDEIGASVSVPSRLSSRGCEP